MTAASGALGRREQRALDRAARRERAQARVVAPIPAAAKDLDPISRDRGRLGALAFVTFAVAALIGHVGVIAVLWAAGEGIRALGPQTPSKKEQKIEVAIVEPPPPPPPVEPPPPPPEPEPEVEKPKPKPKLKPKPKPKVAPPPPDPIDVPDTPPPPPNKPPPRRIVGLSLESTVQGGNGPAFATGNTRMGSTERKAAKPSDVKPLAKTKAPPPSTKVNRRATRVPTEECKLLPPLPSGPRLEPPYPKAYEAQGVETRVVVELLVGKNGKVKRARVAKSAGYAEFDQAALGTAKKQSFTPARCKGKEGTERELTITLTYTFDLPD